MKTIPILFSTEMVQALLEGRKTQTRRVMKPQIEPCNHEFYDAAAWKNDPTQFTTADDNLYWYCGLCANGINPSNDWKGIKCPYGQTGDVLWVRETWALSTKEGVTASEKPHAIPWYYNPVHFDVVFKASSEENSHPDHPEWGKKLWKPSIHMPKTAARLFLKITDVRVERLQDISEADAVAEGIEQMNSREDGKGIVSWKNYMHPDELAQSLESPICSYETLWNSINGRDSWDANPWVWVVTFEKCDKPENF